MKSEHQTKEEMRKILRQARPIRDTNPTAYDKLGQRTAALLWVLEHPKAKRDLTLNKKELALLEALY